MSGVLGLLVHTSKRLYQLRATIKRSLSNHDGRIRQLSIINCTNHLTSAPLLASREETVFLLPGDGGERFMSSNIGA